MTKSIVNQNKLEINNAAADAARVIATAANEATKVIANATAEAIKVSTQNTSEENSKSKFSNLMYKQISLGMSVISLAGILIGSFVYLTNPTKDNYTALQLQEQRIVAQGDTIDSLTKTQQNDTQEVKSAIKDLILQMQKQSEDIVQLTTIINERIPIKK